MTLTRPLATEYSRQFGPFSVLGPPGRTWGRNAELHSNLELLSQTALSPATHLLEWSGNLADPRPWPYKIPKTGRVLSKPEGVLRASLTAPEGAGIQAVSAESLATGKSAELARERIAPCRGCRCKPGHHGRPVVSAAPQRNL